MGILAVCTMRKNRKGWDKEVMNLSKTSERGSTLVKYDKVNKLLAVQWNDNKIVSLLSSLGVYGLVDVQRRVGRNLRTFKTQECVREYQKYMGGVDKGDQIREQSGGFGKASHFKKWYKNIILGMMDFGVLNAYIAWNMHAETSARHYKLTYFEFLLALSEELMTYTDETDANQRGETIHDPFLSSTSTTAYATTTASAFARSASVNTTTNDMGHTYESHKPSSGKVVKCPVCNLEKQMRKDSKQVDIRNQGSEKNQRHLVKCKDCEGDLWLHNCTRPCDRKIFDLPAFANMTCFQIYHSDAANGLFTHRMKNGVRSNGRNYSSPIFKRLRELHGLNPEVRRPKKARSSEEETLEREDQRRDRIRSAGSKTRDRNQSTVGQ